MKTVEWTRNVVPDLAGSYEGRVSWYESIGLDDFYDNISYSSSAYDTMTFTLFGSISASPRIELALDMGHDYPTAYKNIYSQRIFPNGGTSSTNFNLKTLVESNSDGRMCFDFSNIGTAKVCRLCTENISPDKCIFIVRDTGKTIDNVTCDILAYITRSAYGVTGSDAGSGSAFIQSSNYRNLSYTHTTGVDSLTQWINSARSITNNAILQPVCVRGYIADTIYSFDGTMSWAPNRTTTFEVDGHTFYSIGCGLCLKVD